MGSEELLLEEEVWGGGLGFCSWTRRALAALLI